MNANEKSAVNAKANASEKNSVKETENASEKSVVNAKAKANAKANAITKANEMLFESMLKDFDKSLLKTSKGANNDIFKKELFKDMNPFQEKTHRRQLRNYFLSLCISIDKHFKDKNLKFLDSTIAKFIQFSKETYISFNFENLQVSQFCSSNMSDTNKDSIKKAIDAINERVKQLSK